MSKTYDKRPAFRFQQTKPENINDNLDNTLAEVNGNLNANNFPVKGLTFDNFADPSSSDITSNGNKVLTYDAATQNYHRVRRFNVADGGLDVWEPITSIDLQTANWTTGWNKLTDFGSMDYTYLQFDAQEGMLTGNAIIDFFNGKDRIVYQDSEDNTFRIFFGDEWWVQWGVFVNDVLVAETSQIYPRRITCTIPFKVPCGSQAVIIDLRWRAKTTDAIGTNYLGNPTRPIDIYGAEIMCRNTKR